MIGDRLFGIFLVVVFAVMTVELVLLARQNRQLKTNLSRLQGEMMANRGGEVPSLKIGEVLEPLLLPTLNGEPRRLAYDDPVRNTILLIFSPDCPACQENMSNWKRLQESCDPNRERLFYVSTAEGEKTAEFARDHALPEPVLLSDHEALTRYNVFSIPTTVVVGPGGVVKRVWVGVLPEDALDALGTLRS